MELLRTAAPTFLAVREWAHHHGGEALWAAIFAVLFGVALEVLAAMLFLEPPSYTVYLVAGRHHLVHPPTPQGEGHDMDTKYQFEHTDEFKDLTLDGSTVNLVVKEVDESLEAATKIAKELSKTHDTLMVIGHMDSGPTEASLSTYLNERPQVPFIASIQTDDKLLEKACKPPDCYDGLEPLPYLQLSPTNEEQAHWALQFATQRHKQHFLIVESSDTENQAYSDSLTLDYEKAIDDLVQKNHKLNLTKYGPKKDLTREQFEEQLHENDIDCILYAGGFDDALPLLKEIVEIQAKKENQEKTKNSGQRLMVILDDSVVEDRLLTTEFKLSKVNITDEADAEDYKKHISVPGLDAIAIAAELVKDLDGRRDKLDLHYRIKALFRQQTGADARRGLVQVMQDNFRYRSAYVGAVETASGMPRAVYAFDDHHKRSNGFFHVWERTGLATVDVDRWHPPKVPLDSAGGCDETELAAPNSNSGK